MPPSLWRPKPARRPRRPTHAAHAVQNLGLLALGGVIEDLARGNPPQYTHCALTRILKPGEPPPPPPLSHFQSVSPHATCGTGLGWVFKPGRDCVQLESVWGARGALRQWGRGGAGKGRRNGGRKESLGRGKSRCAWVLHQRRLPPCSNELCHAEPCCAALRCAPPPTQRLAAPPMPSSSAASPRWWPTSSTAGARCCEPGPVASLTAARHPGHQLPLKDCSSSMLQQALLCTCLAHP